MIYVESGKCIKLLNLQIKKKIILEYPSIPNDKNKKGKE
jgi:hypothetical protein